MKFGYLALFLLLLHLELSAIEPVTAAANYSEDYYEDTCPDVVDIINQKVDAWIEKDFTLAASLIRLQFHDCAVRGCDRSILLNSTASERTTSVSSTVRGYQVIDEIKAAVEESCPRTVSCADILLGAAREASLFIKGPFWPVPFGRKDGIVSIDTEAERVPHGHENVTTLINFFKSKRLDMQDLITLSGAHTIGGASCGTFINRVNNFNGIGKPDPSLDATYMNMLKKRCSRSTDLVNLDVTTPRTFDTVYYKNLQTKKGLLTTDQELYMDPRTAPLVNTMVSSQPGTFEELFSDAMVKLGNIRVLTGNEGEVRVNCNLVNS
ncbi:peroxidase 7-like [Corylus avellana]|uniref:peroxidase 7-like n=1 Tax=Corylus avellana TaxID=13451 RepID=UPI001E2259D6|nr:peroxidase 7-like [Corylus avellana]